MSDQKSPDHTASGPAYGLKMADKERREPAVVTEFVSFQGLAKRVGPKAPERLKGHRRGHVSAPEVVRESRRPVAPPPLGSGSRI